VGEAPRLERLDRRIRRSKKWGLVVLGGVLVVSVAFGGTLVHGLLLALDAGRGDLVVRAWAGLGILVGLDLFSVFLILRQHRKLDEARKELLDLVSADPSV